MKIDYNATNQANTMTIAQMIRENALESVVEQKINSNNNIMPAVVHIGFHEATKNWVITSEEVRDHLDQGIQWSQQAEGLGEALKWLAESANKSIKIVAHGDNSSIHIGKKYTSTSLQEELDQFALAEKLGAAKISLWSCFGGTQSGIADAIREATQAEVFAADSAVGKGVGLSNQRMPDSLDKAIANLPFELHTNAVGFDIEDNLNGTFGLYLYYGSWHTEYANNGSTTKTEGALSLYTLASGQDGSNPSNYTVEAYGQGGNIQNQTFLPQIPGHITGNIFIPSQYNYIESNVADGLNHITDAGFVPGVNFFFSDHGSGDLVSHNSTNGTTAQRNTYGFQSFYIPSVAPGTYRPFYDGYGGWDNTQPNGANNITANFDAHGKISDALITITGSGKLVFGESPKILIDSVDNDNGVSSTDFVTTGRSVLIRGQYFNVISGDENSIEVTITDTATNASTVYQTSGSELVADNSGAWVLTLPSELAAANYDIKATIVSGANTYTANQDLNIVSASIQKISDDDGVSTSDFKTSDQTLLIEGIYSSATATGIKVTVLDASNNSIVADQDPSFLSGDTWKYDLTGTTLAPGSYTIQAVVSDNNGSSTVTKAVEVQSLPNAPVIVNITDDNATSVAFQTSDTTVRVSGTFDNTVVTSSTSGELRLSLGGNTYTNINGLNVDYTQGTWFFDSKTLDVSQYIIKAEVIDTNGLYNVSTQSLLIIDEADTTPPLLPTFTSLEDSTGVLSNFTSKEQSITIKGTYDSSDALGGFTVNYGEVTYTLGIDTALITNGNNWQLSVSDSAVTGTVTVTAKDGGGNAATTTQLITISNQDSDNNGLVDGRDIYHLADGDITNGIENSGIIITNKRGSTFSHTSSSRWDSVKAVQDGNNQWKVLLRGDNSYEGKWYYWNVDEKGVITSGSGWKQTADAVNAGWDSIFGNIFNPNIDTSLSTKDGDADGSNEPNGIVDDITNYHLTNGSTSVRLHSADLQSYSHESSANWDVFKAVEINNAWKVLVKGANSMDGMWSVWDAGVSGTVTQASTWMSTADSLKEGWEQIFGDVIEVDSIIGIQNPNPIENRNDLNSDGLMDDMVIYHLDNGDNGDGLAIHNIRGNTFSDASTSRWDAVLAVEDNNNNWKVLLQGTGSYDGQWYYWNVDDAGLITSGSGWKSYQGAIDGGWESFFGDNLNGFSNNQLIIEDPDRVGLIAM